MGYSFFGVYCIWEFPNSSTQALELFRLLIKRHKNNSLNDYKYTTKFACLILLQIINITFLITVISNEPKTYATLVKSGGNSGTNSFSSTALTTSPNNQTTKPSVSPVSTAWPLLKGSDDNEVCVQPPATRTEHREAPALGPPLGQPPLGQRSASNRGARANNAGGRNATRQDSLRGNRTGFNEDSGGMYFIIMLLSCFLFVSRSVFRR